MTLRIGILLFTAVLVIGSFAFCEPVEVLAPAVDRSLEDIEAANVSSIRFLEALAREDQQGWKAIRWVSTIDAAREAARESHKPILLFLSVRDVGTHDPALC